MALGRLGDVSGLTHHSDRGGQLCSQAFRSALRHSGIECSMCRKGNCRDKAVAESFFATFKKELMPRREQDDQQRARASTFEHIVLFYNRVRRHSGLNGLSPEQLEQQG